MVADVGAGEAGGYGDADVEEGVVDDCAEDDLGPDDDGDREEGLFEVGFFAGVGDGGAVGEAHAGGGVLEELGELVGCGDVDEGGESCDDGLDEEG